MKFLIIDGYPEKSRLQFDTVGMTLAGKLYEKMLFQHIPDAQTTILYVDGILWPGCNLTVYHDDDERVQRMIEIVDLAFEAGIPQFGSCWAAQISVYVAGGKWVWHEKYI